MKALIINAVIYFTMVFFAGFVLGIIRTLLLVPMTGQRYAELIEMPVMIGVVFFSARYIRKRAEHQESFRLFLIGALALLILVAFEFTLVLWVQGMSFSDYLQRRDPVSGTAYICALIVFMLMPWFLNVVAGHCNKDSG